MPAPGIHNKVLPQKYLIVSQTHAERITNSAASFCADNFLCFPVQPCKLNRVVRRANATLDMNSDSSFFVLTLLQTSFGQSCIHIYTPSLTRLAPRQYKKILRQNPLKTSEISKLLKSKKSSKENLFLFF
jgi:hypothetical protein